MPTPSRANVEAARALVQAHLEKGGPGAVVPYLDVARAVEEACPRLTPQRARHALRAACDSLADEGELEPWGRRLRDGRWVVAWLRAPGRAGPPAAPKPRVKQAPAKRYAYTGRFRVAAELLALVEEAILDLLADPPGEVENRLAAAFVPPPGPGWTSYTWLTSRCGFRLQGKLNPQTKLNVIGCAVRSLERRGKLALVARRMRNGKRRVRWVRLAVAAAPAIPCHLAAPLIPGPRVASEPSRL